MRSAIMLFAAFGLSACASSGSGLTASLPRPSVSTVSTTPVPVPKDVTVRAPAESGLADVIGERAGSLSERFGLARIDLKEGEARKLQFAGETCVLDLFLYPVAAGTEPVVTHVDARLRTTGADTDKSRCIAEVERR